MLPKIIAVEGGVCAGKTTLISEINTASIPDYWKYRGIFSKNLHFPATSIAQLLENNQILSEIEIKRLEQAQTHEDQTVLIDRSFLSLMGFDFAFMKMFRIEGFDKILSFWDKKRKIIPQRVIFLDISHSERMERFKTRGKECAQTILLTEEFNLYFKEFFNIQSLFMIEFFQCSSHVKQSLEI